MKSDKTSLLYKKIIKGISRDLKKTLNEEYVPRQRKTTISKLNQYTCHPLTKEELKEIIIERIENEGYTCDLNDIDVSLITDMSHLFDAYYYDIFDDFNGDVSLWNVSNVTAMEGMFSDCKSFNQDISSWNVSKVTNMRWMFCGCVKFNSDLSSWDVSNVTDMSYMFAGDNMIFNLDLSRWNVSKVTDMEGMFEGCEKFDYDLSSWRIQRNCNTEDMFEDCPLNIKKHPFKLVNEEYIPRQR